jgi:hypothetical protein
MDREIENWLNGTGSYLNPKDTPHRNYMRSQLTDAIKYSDDEELEFVREKLVKKKSRFQYLLLYAGDRLNNTTKIAALRILNKLRSPPERLIKRTSITLNFQILDGLVPKTRMWVMNEFRKGKAKLDLTEEEINTLLFPLINNQQKEAETLRDHLIIKSYNITDTQMEELLIDHYFENSDHVEVFKNYIKSNVKPGGYPEENKQNSKMLIEHLQKNAEEVIKMLPPKLIAQCVRIQISDKFCGKGDLYLLDKIKKIGKLEEIKRVCKNKS